jgi:hypothetical protein
VKTARHLLHRTFAPFGLTISSEIRNWVRQAVQVTIIGGRRVGREED